MMPGGTFSPRLNFTRSLPSATTLVAKSCDMATVPSGPGTAIACGLRAEPPRRAAPRRHVEPAARVGPEHADQPRGRGHLRVVGEPADVVGAAQGAPPRGRASGRVRSPCPSPRRATTWPKPPSPSRMARVGVSTTSVICGLGLSVPALQARRRTGARGSRRASRGRAGWRAISMRGDPRGVALGHAARGEDFAGQALEQAGLHGSAWALHYYPPMSKWEPRKIRLGVSACLLGQEVRYDGGHKRDAFLTDVLGAFVEWVPVCPEVEVGLGVPRPPIRLVGDRRRPAARRRARPARISPRGCGAGRAGASVRWRRSGLHGYVLKRGSPSCGLDPRARVRRGRHAGPRRSRRVRRARSRRRCRSCPWKRKAA